MIKKSAGFFEAIEPAPPTGFEYLTAFTSSGTFTPPETGWYRVFVFGKCGDGSGNTIGDSTTGGNGGTGGGSGGVAISMGWLIAGIGIPVIINTSLTSVRSLRGRLIAAYAGVNGTPSTPGNGGTAIGGNIANLPGGKGGLGGMGNTGDSAATDGNPGELNGALGGLGAIGIGPGGGGGGGAQYTTHPDNPYVATDNTSYHGGNGASNGVDGGKATEYPTLVTGANMRLYGGGSGSGGSGRNTFAVVPGSKGQTGVVIIEKALPSNPA